MKKVVIVLIISFLLSDFSIAQVHMIRGKVIDKTTGKGIPNVQVRLRGTDIYTFTDSLGNYSLIIPDTIKRIEFSQFQNYKLVDILMAGNLVNIILAPYSKTIFDLSLEQLLNVRIQTHVGNTHKSLKLPIDVNVITSKDLEVINMPLLRDVLEYSTGMSTVNGEGGFFYTTTIRGNTKVNYNTNTLLMLDGIPIYIPYDGSFDLQAIPLSSIKQIEIIKGAESVLFGSNAINATINIIPQNFTPHMPFYSNFRYGIKLFWGTHNSYGTSVFLNSKHGSNTINIYTDFIHEQAPPMTYKDELGNRLQYSRPYCGNNLLFNFQHKNISVNFLHYYRQELTVRTRRFQVAYFNNNKKVVLPERQNEQMYLTSFKYHKNIRKYVKLVYQTSYSFWQSKKYLLSGHWNYTSNYVYNDLHFVFSPNNRYYNVLGVEIDGANASRYKSELGKFDIGAKHLPTFQGAVYLWGLYMPLSKLQVNYGLRYFASVYGQTFFQDLLPSFGISYLAQKNTSFKLLFGQGFRVPTYFEKEVNSYKLKGNPLLKPEKSFSYDFISTVTLKRLSFNVDFYYYEIYDQILRVFVSDTSSVMTYKNIGKNAYWGIEFTMRYALENRMYGFAGYSLNYGYNVVEHYQLPFTYRNMLDFGMGIKLTSLMSMYVTGKYLSRWGPAPAYFLLNAALDWSLFKTMPLKFEVRVENLLNQDIYEPEIARHSSQVPVIPKIQGRIFWLSFMYNFYR